jgi:6-phospho-3-hexuloisomerase
MRESPPAPAGAVLSRAAKVVGEIRQVLDSIEPDALTALLAATAQARRLFFAAQGRSGLVARATAMRWMHMGVTSYFAGETVTPAISDGDLLMCLSASGSTAATLIHAGTARAAGARVVALTTTHDSPLAGEAELVVVIPAGASVSTAQHAGSLFEQSCLILGDVLCDIFQQQHAIPDRELNRRHANLL